MQRHVLTTSRIDSFRVPVRVEVNVRRGPKWLRDWLTPLVRWTLRKLDAWPEPAVERQETHWIDTDGRELLPRLIKSRRDIERVWRGDVRLFVGPDVWPDLLRELSDAEPFGFIASAPYCHNGEVRAVGVPVTMVPWMRGALLAPITDDRSALPPSRLSEAIW